VALSLVVNYPLQGRKLESRTLAPTKPSRPDIIPAYARQDFKKPGPEFGSRECVNLGLVNIGGFLWRLKINTGRFA
jgi:hypothetical protein